MPVSAIGFAPITEMTEARGRLRAWIDQGHHGTMGYLAQSADHGDPRAVFSEARTVIAVALPYEEWFEGVRHLSILGQVAGYAQGPDYHATVRTWLRQLGQKLADLAGKTVRARACVDTAPLLERELAQLAGLGFIGKSNMLIVPRRGSRVLLGELLVDIDISPDTPMGQRCGRCSMCLDACPTQAFVGPFQLDARRCISYLTIEYSGWIPTELRSRIGTRIFGCDVCQDVCPYNRSISSSSRGRAAEVPSDDRTVGALQEWLTLTSSGYRRLTAGSAMRRTSRAQLLRNASVAAGNTHSPLLVRPLSQLLQECKYPIVRGHAAWALGEIATPDAELALVSALHHEAEPRVIDEIRAAVQRQPIKGT